MDFERKAAVVPINRDEIIDEVKRNICDCGGDLTDWCVGTGKDARGPFFYNHLVAELGDGLVYREAFTADAARAIQEHLIHDCGLTPHCHPVPRPNAVRPYPDDAPEPGKRVATVTAFVTVGSSLDAE